MTINQITGLGMSWRDNLKHIVHSLGSYIVTREKLTDIKKDMQNTYQYIA